MGAHPGHRRNPARSLQDFDSPFLKHKKHWNSFTAEGFWLPAAWVEGQLLEHGRVDYDVDERERLLKQDMRCQHCGAVLATIPQLKAHLAAGGCRGAGGGRA